MYLNPVKKAYLEKIMLKFIYSFIYLFQNNSGNLLQENYQKDKFGPWHHGMHNVEILADV